VQEGTSEVLSRGKDMGVSEWYSGMLRGSPLKYGNVDAWFFSLPLLNDGYLGSGSACIYIV
jgi:hypothetical protein